MQLRQVAQQLESQRVSDGAGVKINRVVVDQAALDPFLMIDELKSCQRDDFAAGFPDHPHRGFETITYMREGAFRHRDSLGNEGRIAAGGVQWMTAGRGIIHSEMPEPAVNQLHGFQIWLNLPAADKMMRPRYRDISPDEIPHATHGTSRTRVIGGAVLHAEQQVAGPMTGRATLPHLFDVELAANGQFETALDPRLMVALYVHTGEARVGNVSIAHSHGALLGAGDGVQIESAGGAGLLLLAGLPLHEPIAQAGPFVMNTRAELQQAFVDYQSGAFQAEPEVIG